MVERSKSSNNLDRGGGRGFNSASPISSFSSQNWGNAPDSYAGGQKGESTTSHGFVHRVKTPAPQIRRERRKKEVGAAKRGYESVRSY